MRDTMCEVFQLFLSNPIAKCPVRVALGNVRTTNHFRYTLIQQVVPAKYNTGTTYIARERQKDISSCESAMLIHFIWYIIEL